MTHFTITWGTAHKRRDGTIVPNYQTVIAHNYAQAADLFYRSVSVEPVGDVTIRWTDRGIRYGRVYRRRRLVIIEPTNGHLIRLYNPLGVVA